MHRPIDTIPRATADPAADQVRPTFRPVGLSGTLRSPERDLNRTEWALENSNLRPQPCESGSATRSRRHHTTCDGLTCDDVGTRRSLTTALGAICRASCRAESGSSDRQVALPRCDVLFGGGTEAVIDCLCRRTDSPAPVPTGTGGSRPDERCWGCCNRPNSDWRLSHWSRPFPALRGTGGRQFGRGLPAWRRIVRMAEGRQHRWRQP